MTTSQKKQLPLVLLGYAIFSFVGVFLKFGSLFPFFSAPFLACFVCSLFCAFGFAVIWQKILQTHDLMLAYAYRGTLFLWTFLWAVLFFDETVTRNNIFGALIIIVGISLVAKDE